MKKKIIITCSIVGLLLIGLFIGNLFWQKQRDSPYLTKDKEQTFWLLSDVHFLAPELHDDGKAFTFIKGTAAGKDLDYQAESLAAFVDQALVKKPDSIIITGDLTLNGEKISAEKMVALMAPLQKANIAVYCLPGNHDIHDGWARKYQKDQQFKVSQISPENFKELFPDGYQAAASKASDDLSYSLSINPNYRFIMLDSNIYTKDTSSAAPITKGLLKDSTLTWLQAELAAAKSLHQQPLIFIHHNLLKHNPTVYKGYVLDNAAKVKKLLKDYGVKVVFSGHIHAQDIMAEDDLTEIVTSSYDIIDHGYGEVILKENQLHYQRKTISVSNWAKKKIKEKNQTYDFTTLTNHDTYLKELFFNDGVRLTYQDFMSQEIYDEKTIDPAADLVGKINLAYFKGEDNLTDSEVANIKESSGYQALLQHKSFLKDYVDFALQDQNLPDDEFNLTFD